MTVRVESGISLEELSEILAKSGQWLPVDPPGASRLTVKDLLDGNLFGPAISGFGFIREHLIGLKAVLADGRMIESGGNVVKNVAGYDLQKLFIGAEQSLGIITEAVFKLAPVPRVRRVLTISCRDISTAASVSQTVRSAPVTPEVFDWYRLGEMEKNNEITVVLRFGGNTDDVDEQAARMSRLGFCVGKTADYDEWLLNQGRTVQRTTVPPSSLDALIQRLNGQPFIARAGNGIVYHQDPSLASRPNRPLFLEKRIKEMFDPLGIMPVPPWL